MSSSNGLRSTWEKHNRMLGGRLDQILAALQKKPGLVERNERRLQEYAKRQAELLKSLETDDKSTQQEARR